MEVQRSSHRDTKVALVLGEFTRRAQKVTRPGAAISTLMTNTGFKPPFDPPPTTPETNMVLGIGLIVILAVAGAVELISIIQDKRS
jgi:hypothetical protein